jgi:hypothetical protein
LDLKRGGEIGMRKLITIFICLLLATSLTLVTGCSEKKQEPAKSAAEAVKPAEPEKKAEEAKTAEAKPTEKAPEKK